MERWNEARQRIARFEDWRKRMAQELAELPETMRRMREGSANFEIVGQRLARSSEALEEITRFYERTIADSTRRSVDAIDTVRSQLEQAAKVGSPERWRSAASEMQRTIESLADLNPFWRRPP